MIDSMTILTIKIMTMITKAINYVEETEGKGGVVDMGDSLTLHIHNFIPNPTIPSHEALHLNVLKGMKKSKEPLKALGIDHLNPNLGIDHPGQSVQRNHMTTSKQECHQ